MQKQFLVPVFNLFLVLSVLLSGCGEFSYKRGATANDLAKTKKICQAEGLKTEVEVNECLEKNGWSVHHLDDLDLFAVASVNPNNQNPYIENSKSAESAFVIDAAEKKSPDKESVATNEPVAEKSSPTSEKKPQKPSDPMDIYTVSSWWKMGGSPALLETHTNQCVTTLGEAHKPNTQTQQVTRGFVVCMYEKGWKALKAK